MISIELINGNTLAARINNLYPEVLEAARLSITWSLMNLTRHVKANKLTGQVLRNRTGRLRASIHPTDAVISGDTITGTVGTNVEYAAIHEYGYSGPVTVKEHMRTIKEAWGKPLKFPVAVNVRSHTRQVILPERSFLRSALQDLGPQIAEDLRKSLAMVGRK